MSDSDAAPVFDVSVQTSDEDARIVLLDGKDRVVQVKDGRARIPRGLYTVRVELGGRIREQIVRVSSNAQVEVAAPPRRSAAPLVHTRDASRYETTHEYYVEPAIRLSTLPTRAAFGGLDGHLMVFVRRARATDESNGPLADGLSLCALDGTVLSSFEPSETETDPRAGWLALSAPAAAGCYLLRYRGTTGGREQPVVVPTGWTTSLFVPVDHTPELCRTRIVMSRGAFDPTHAETVAADRALEVLTTGRGVVRADAMDTLLVGKFHNPMLGLIGLHLMLAGQGSPRDPDTRVLAQIVENLRRILGPNPDVQALELMVRQRMGDEFVLPRIEHPPMLRASFDALVQASFEHPEVIPQGSPMERVTLVTVPGLAWTAWEADAITGAPVGGLEAAPRTEPRSAWVRATVRDWLAHDDGASPVEMARALGLPTRLVQEAVRQVTAAGEVESWWERLAETLESKEDLSRLVRILERRGRDASTRGKADKAVELLRRAASVRSDKLADHPGAIAGLEEALRLKPDSVDTAIALSKSLRNMGQARRAGRVLMEALERHDDKPTTLVPVLPDLDKLTVELADTVKADGTLEVLLDARDMFRRRESRKLNSSSLGRLLKGRIDGLMDED